MENGIYITLTMVKNGQRYDCPPRLAAEFVPVLLDAIIGTGLEGSDAILKKIGYANQQI